MDATLHLSDADASAALARRLAPELRPGDVLLLGGEIGAGKTHFARALIRARLGRDEDVPSPTYTLVQTYDDGRAEIWHADLYRLSGPDEAFELGLDEAFATAICLVEWPDRLGTHVPADALRLDFAMLDRPGRRLRVHAEDGRWAKRVPLATAAHD
ncbi:tRNA (adenosine(37)-N6)-threonylcarbamoyltransferase complex ATPase subunit type 1 TsaE [Roseitranquillus sediminis]|uniref:tRNA (adenosine(37)-N6)-threonylcarbamoyltransferase complex ATPase subunit type 1 TsaE n=1 Tax=Roseitranquillus sediminis TaxID=2809051 RepID=UPI001D0CCB95|nr:tRNA (adenosine(37)-N6)-threonylcarbamoyltransferase complex ATPase subunit type 1 TsaE [Roseitranquillus sediminis]MBM9596256.1 tRNA (adenosine(37)-N6)-threonylcarbamoyltransferase complex ATPase subunit type 1 TsaE [Roseitranquillus sediminis]